MTLGETALQLATDRGYKAIVDLLNEAASIQKNAKDGKKTIYFYLFLYLFVNLFMSDCFNIKQSDPMSPNILFYFSCLSLNIQTEKFFCL